MTENTPSTNQISYGWAAFRGETSGVSSDVAYAEFNRWLAAHDQGIRDACRPAEMTAREHVEAAFEAACPVPAGRVPTGVPVIARLDDGDIFVHAMGRPPVPNDRIEVRTLEPLPLVIPEDCMAVWASVKYDKTRRLCVRSTGSGNWVRGDDVIIGEALIDPKPVPEEER